VVAHPRAALQVPVALRSDRCRKCVIAPPTESRRWPEMPGSVRQPPLGGFCLRQPLRSNGVGGFCSCRPLWYPNDRRRQVLFVPIAALDATGVAAPADPLRGDVAPHAGCSVQNSVLFLPATTSQFVQPLRDRQETVESDDRYGSAVRHRNAGCRARRSLGLNRGSTNEW